MAVAGSVRELGCDVLCPLDARADRPPTIADAVLLVAAFPPDDRLRALAIATRRLALQLLFEIDSSGGDRAIDDVLSRLDEVEDLGPIHRERVEMLVRGSWAGRSQADRLFASLAPTWPASRQPGVDRALLRLSHFEITSGLTPAKIAVNEAVELAKRFSTERSPSFINGLLGKLVRSMQDEASAAQQ
ncbi:MAG: transcription antitermination factor NusB [Phycisphaerales bacterium]|nr:transcription antitermination factor NusB [Phycisphaerales bacterium]